jgi:hypothetical protein
MLKAPDMLLIVTKATARAMKWQYVRDLVTGRESPASWPLGKKERKIEKEKTD